MTGGLRIYQGMNIKIGSSRKKGDCTKKQSQETTLTDYVRKREHIICGSLHIWRGLLLYHAPENI